VQTKNYEWDMVGIGESVHEQAIHEGFLEPVDLSIIKKDSLPKGMISEYGVTAYSLGTNIVYRKDKFPKGGPQNWADFWDVKKFPGTRCLFNRSFTCLAFALLADGVPADKLYPMDLDRAFKKMDEIKPHIKVWWTQGTQSQQLIRDEVDMIGMWSARAVDLIEDGVPLELVWNGCENYNSNWCVAKGAPNAKLAWELIGFAAQAKPQAEFTKLLPYGPTNPDSLALVPEARLRQTPSWPDNAKVSFVHDSAWLAPRLSKINERWAQWMTS
jgi:putative spermidine/putrescine transport system substrate-binding protein